MAPSFSDLLRSTRASVSMAETRPSPSQLPHMPCGSLKEKRLDPPTCGWPSRDQMTRSIV